MKALKVSGTVGTRAAEPVPHSLPVYILLVPTRQTSTIDRKYALTKPFVYGSGGATLTRTCSHCKQGFRIRIRELFSDPYFEKGRFKVLNIQIQNTSIIQVLLGSVAGKGSDPDPV